MFIDSPALIAAANHPPISGLLMRWAQTKSVARHHKADIETSASADLVRQFCLNSGHNRWHFCATLNLSEERKHPWDVAKHRLRDAFGALGRSPVSMTSAASSSLRRQKRATARSCWRTLVWSSSEVLIEGARHRRKQKGPLGIERPQMLMRSDMDVR